MVCTTAPDASSTVYARLQLGTQEWLSRAPNGNTAAPRPVIRSSAMLKLLRPNAAATRRASSPAAAARGAGNDAAIAAATSATTAAAAHAPSPAGGASINMTSSNVAAMTPPAGAAPAAAVASTAASSRASSTPSAYVLSPPPPLAAAAASAAARAAGSALHSCLCTPRQCARWHVGPQYRIRRQPVHVCSADANTQFAQREESVTIAAVAREASTTLPAGIPCVATTQRPRPGRTSTVLHGNAARTRAATPCSCLTAAPTSSPVGGGGGAEPADAAAAAAAMVMITILLVACWLLK